MFSCELILGGHFKWTIGKADGGDVVIFLIDSKYLRFFYTS